MSTGSEFLNGKCQVACLLGFLLNTIAPPHFHDQPIGKQYLDRDNKSGGVQRVLSVQLTIYGQGAADVVQGEDAVGVP